VLFWFLTQPVRCAQLTVSAISLELLEGMVCGITVSQRAKAQLGIRAHPWAEVRCERPDLLETLQVELLALSIGSTTLGTPTDKLRIQGINNCSLLTPYVPEKYAWWNEAMTLFDAGEHRTKNGLLKILQLRPGERLPKNLCFLND